MDDLPWDSAAETSKAVDEDLQLVCRRATQHYRREILDAAAAAKRPSDACRALGCGALPPPHLAVLETTMKLATRPAALLKLAPVFVMAFVFPLLFMPMLYPPAAPVNVKTLAAKAEEGAAGRARGTGVGAGAGAGAGAAGDGETSSGKRGGGGKSKKTQ
jgi:hypothetical protein